MSKRPGVTAGSPSTQGMGAVNDTVDDSDFISVPTRDEKRKQRKLSKQRPQFQFDISYFNQGKWVGIAVSTVDLEVCSVLTVAYPGHAPVHRR